MSYLHVDHRAPIYVPRADPVVNDMALVGVSLIPITAVGVFVPVAIVNGGIVLYGLMVLSILCLLRWIQVCRRYIVRIPDGDHLQGYDANKALVAIRAAYKNNPELREVIEPVLIASYDLAQCHRISALQERRRAVSELVTENGQEGGINDADLEELRQILSIRREMRRDGLL